MIKAVVFDCFGVLVESTYASFREKHFSDSPAKIREMHDIDSAANLGYMTQDELYLRLSDLAGISLEQAVKELTGNPVNEKLFRYIDTLKPEFKIGFISNIAGNFLGNLFTKEQLGVFDDMVLSYKTGLIKPDRRIYELSAQNLGLALAECVFVDDQERYVAGAIDAGMKGVTYKNFRQFEADIHKLLH